MKWSIIKVRRQEKLSLIQGLMAGFFFGTSAIFIRFASGLDALTIGFYRLLLASFFLLIIKLLLKRGITFSMRNSPLWRLSVLGILLGLHFVTFIYSVKTTAIINATVLVNTMPAITLVIHWAWRKERPPLARLFGLSLSMAGIFLISMAEVSFSSHNLIGDLMALVAAALWAIYLIIGKPAREKTEILSTMIPIYFLGCVVLMMPLLSSGGFIFPTMNQWAPLIGLAIFPTAIGHTLHFSSMKTLRPYQTAVLALLEPIVATILALIIFYEVPAIPFFIGASVILLGIYLIVKP